MFDRSTVGRSARLLLFASCSFVSTRVANAQSTAEYRHLVDSLGTIWRSQARELALADSTRRSLALRDTLHVGHFVIVADSQYASIARIAAERVSPLLDRAYGKFAGKLDSRVLLFGQHRGRAIPHTSSKVESSTTTGFSGSRPAI